MSLKNDENYKRYKALSKDELQLPAPNQDEDGDVVIETGELFCRISGCSDSRLFRQPYLLRKHVQRGHPEVTLARAPVGKPTERSLKQAKAFYRSVVEAFDARVAEKEEQKKTEEETLEGEKAGTEPSAKRRRLK